jgi:hypothetical protein
MMRNSLVKVGLVFGLILLGSGILSAQQKLSTTIYLDWQLYLNKDGYRTAVQKSIVDNFAFRRAYFRYENKINDRLSFRLTFDADTVKAATTSGSPDDKFRPFIKHLYFEYADLIPKSVVRVGIADTLTFKLAEDKWGYRSVAKTLVDGYSDITGKGVDATSADLGAAILGTVTKQLRYAFSVVTGEAYSHPEKDKYKKFAGQVQLIPAAGLSFVGYIDYEKQDATHSAYTYKGDAFFEMVKNLVIAFEYFTYNNDLNVDKVLGKYKRTGYSIWGRYIFTPDKFAAFARYDNYDPNSVVDNDETRLTILGLDWAPWTTNVRFQPNIWFLNYTDPGKKSDVYFALTFFMSF